LTFSFSGLGFLLLRRVLERNRVTSCEMENCESDDLEGTSTAILLCRTSEQVCFYGKTIAVKCSVQDSSLELAAMVVDVRR
jgi:hypothetical protein